MGKIEERGRTMESAVYPLNELKEYKYVVVLSRYQGKLLLSRHQDRDTWETQGGHIEPGETPLQAARRELWEESGALEFLLSPLCDYFAGDEVSHANGMVFVAEVKNLGPLPESEMVETALFEELPENLTYPNITPLLYRRWMQGATGER